MDFLHANSPLLAAAVPAVAALVLLAAWIGLHRLTKGKSAWAARTAFVARTTVGAGVLGLTIGLLGRVLTLNLGWGRWVLAALGAAAVEAVIALSARERRTLRQATARRLLTLRVALVLLVLLMLLQPVFTFEVDTLCERFIAVLVDESASMDLTDPQATASEKLQLARLYGLPFAAKANRLETAVPQWDSLRQEFEAQTSGLGAAASPDAETTAGRLRRRRQPIVDLLEKARQLGTALGTDLTTAGEGPAKGDPKVPPAIQGIRDRLAQLQAQWAESRKLIESEPAPALAGALEPLRAQWQRSIDGLRQVADQLRLLATMVDEATIASLDSNAAGDLARVLKEPRSRIARKVLLDAREGQRAIVDELGRGHAVRVYRFAAKPKATDLGSWREGATGSLSARDELSLAGKPPVAPDAAASDGRQATDLAAALSRVQQDIPADRLAGVLIVTDGRHNHGAPAEPLARRLAQASVPVCSVVVGSAVVPRDAALTDVSGPQTVFLDDRVAVNAHVRAIGMKGQDLTVKLVADGETVDQQTVRAADDDFRTLVPLGYVPKGVGMHSYQVEMEPPAGDFVKENNRIECHVAVTDSRIKLLLVDDRPRWEFRYLRNLFCGRDKTVQLQHVLLAPDRLEGAPERARVPASTSRPFGEFEATALPETPEEWLRFETIILGDLPPSALDKTAIATLERFVGRQGGTLVVIAGPNFMPHAYTDTKLADLLPATFASSAGPIPDGPEPAYRLVLSPEGGTHTIMRVRANPTDNAAAWNSLPPMAWRHPVERLKPGAAVLAYAEPVDPQQAASPGPPPVPRSATERMRLQRRNPLILLQKYGAGNVLLLTFDRTWRLRYRIGDTYHHRFWTQVLRWATANKLSAGTDHVRLGTDRYRYQAGEPVLVRAQLLDEENAPVTGASVTARVYRGDRLVLKKTLAFVPDSTGLYQGDLGALTEPGTYRVELGGSDVARLQAVDGAEKTAAEFLVTSLERTSELVDVSADWRLPTQLAELTGGRVAGPADARGLLDTFTAGSKNIRQQRNIPLWDSWPMLLLTLCAVSAEWILRKKAGLT